MMIDTPMTGDLIRGAAEVEPGTYGLVPHRLPAWARAECPDPQLAMAESQPSGVRVVLRTRGPPSSSSTQATTRSCRSRPSCATSS